MPFWVIALGVLSLFGVLATIIGIVPLYTSMITMGLALPIWVVLANLWWIWLLLLPIVRFHRSGRPILGWVVAGAMASLAMLMVLFAEDPLLWTYPGFSNPVDAKTVGRIGTRTLLRMGRKDLVQDLFTRADWEALRPVYQKTNMFSSPEFSAVDMRTLFLGTLTDIRNPANPC